MKKQNRTLLIVVGLVVLALLACCCCAAGFLGWGFFTIANDPDIQELVDEIAATPTCTPVPVIIRTPCLRRCRCRRHSTQRPPPRCRH